MVNLFDIMRQAQSGSALDNLSRQFGLSGPQTQRALEALLPAFTLGFQRSAQNPNVFGQILEMMSSGRYAPFYEGMFQPQPAQASGQEVLDRLFGSPDVSRQIAAQASAATGIGVQVLQQMLPAIAATLMGGLFKFASVEGLSEFLRAWADWLRSLRPADAAPKPGAGLASGTPYGAWSDIMGAMLGTAPAPARQPEPSPTPSPAAPWADFMQAMLKGLPSAEKAAPPPPPPPQQPNPFEVLSQMFETGREVQQQHLANLHTILDGIWGAGKSRA